jgi:hypothetical protein
MSVLSFEWNRDACRYGASKFDGSVKSPISTLRFIPRHCEVPISTPHSSGFASLDLGAFYETIRFSTFYGASKFEI